MTGKCVICNKDLTSDSIKVSQKGIQALIKASKSRNDGKHIVLSGVESVVVHGSCRKRYTRSSTILADLREATSSAPSASTSQLRSSRPKFDFETKCLFCTEVIDDEFYVQEKKKPKERRREVYPVRSIGFSDTIMDAVKKRNDKWGDEVSRRIINARDIVAAGGIYHVDCYKRFLLSHTPTKTGCGRPKEDYVSIAMEQIQCYLEEHKDCQMSLDELMDQVSGIKPSIKTVKSKLKETYGDKILISKVKSHKSVICFLDIGHKILNESWYTSKCDDENEERLRVIKAAAMIIKQDIQSRVYDTSHYPPSGTFLNDAEQVIPESLKVFLDSLLTKKGDDKKIIKKKISLAHAIISIIRPRSFISSVLPFFHASGHFQYARCAHLYLQDMLQLQSQMNPREFELFAQQGYFTMRRSDAFWAGVWSDMIIEQTLMRSMKSSGGMTRGRGITDSTLAKWLKATLHSFSGCNTTSAIHRKGKVSVVKLFEHKPKIRDIAAIFYNPTSTSEEIAESGERMFLTMYRAATDQLDLNRHRY